MQGSEKQGLLYYFLISHISLIVVEPCGIVGIHFGKIIINDYEMFLKERRRCINKSVVIAVFGRKMF